MIQPAAGREDALWEAEVLGLDLAAQRIGGIDGAA
jgi:hypothetical protein